jgi:hypothetical protein
MVIESWILNLFLIYDGKPLVPHPPEFATHAACIEAGREMSEAWHAIGWSQIHMHLQRRSSAGGAIRINPESGLSIHTWSSSSSAGATPPYHANSSQIG